MTTPALAHHLGLLDRAGGALLLGGRTAAELAAEHGTPLYVVDRAVAARKLAVLREALGPDVAVSYAVKANPHPDVIRLFLGLRAGFDLASGGELAAVLAAGVPADACGFAGPGKSEAELRAAVAAGVGSLNVESEGELDLADAAAADLGASVRVCLRLNPRHAIHRSGMRIGGGAQPFGIDEEQAPAVLAAMSAGRWPRVRFAGFHVFAGSQNLAAEPLIASFERVFQVLSELAPSCPGGASAVARVNLGGGFGIPYFAADEPLDIVRVGAALRALVAAHRDRFPDTRFHVESGRYLVGEAGVYLCRVRYRKTSRGQVFLVTDGGLHHHLAASGNFGQVIRKDYPVVAPAHLDVDPTETPRVVGPLCTPLDVLAAATPLPPLLPGDLVAVLASGAYGLTASPRGFLSHPDAREVVVGAAAP